MSTDGGVTNAHYVIIPTLLGGPIVLGCIAGYFGGKYSGYLWCKEYIDYCNNLLRDDRELR